MNRILLLIIFFPLFITKGQTIPNRLRVAIVGDSLAYGLYASDTSKTYANIVASELNAELLLVASVRNLPGAIARFDEVENWQPDIIILEIGLNDISGYGGDALNEKHWKSIYKLLVKSYQHTGANVILVNTFSGWTDVHEDAQERYNEYIRDVSLETKADHVDIYSASFQCKNVCVSKWDEASAFDPGHGDNFHPSDAGHRVIADAILGVVQQ